MAQPYATPIERSPWVTDDPRCAVCGRHNCCDAHHSAYSAWLGRMQHGFGGDSDDPEDGIGP